MIIRTEGSGRPLVALHGFGLDHRVMLPLEHMVDDAPWRRVYVDLPWTAAARRAARDTGSVRVPTSTLEVARGVVAELRDALGDEPFAVVGNSFGGMVARYVAHELRGQVLGLATFAGVVEAVHAARTVPERTVLRVDPSVLDRAGDTRDDFVANSVVQDAATFDAFVAGVLPGLRGADQAVLDAIADDYALPVEPEAAHPEPFTAPTLHLFGRQDEVVGYEDGLALRDHYPRGSFVVLDTAGHNVHLEQPTVTAALVRDWLARMDATA
ncbi:alpha/beta hydrolase [Curtobacterium sp. UCD-KPL2560]|uniref:alpha/beta fold hydrolase n=1 Tax=Curtobacterium sp. UCD-KPL2560 TaxID=1885315 RepID=UPI00082472CE|nr:alpha/beta hydrolase [Curtobacterium sp. UCD-KPL2560]